MIENAWQALREELLSYFAGKPASCMAMRTEINNRWQSFWQSAVEFGAQLPPASVKGIFVVCIGDGDVHLHVDMILEAEEVISGTMIHRIHSKKGTHLSESNLH